MAEKYGSYTENINLYNPDLEDLVDVGDINKNNENIDKNIARLVLLIQQRAPINDPSFSGRVTAPNTTISGSDVVVTITDMKNYHLVKQVTKVNSLPATGQLGYIYIVGSSGNTLEYVWNGQEYVQL